MHTKSMSARAITTLILITTLFSSLHNAHAQAAPGGTAAEALAHYEAGERAYRLGDFSRAVEEFRKSYALVPKDPILFNLGQSYRQLGDFKQALHFYRQFQSVSTSEAEKQVVQKKINEAERQLKEQEKNTPPVAPAPVAATPAPEPVRVHKHWYKSGWGWGLTVSGLVLTGVGGGLLGYSGNLFGLAGSLDNRADIESQARQYQTAGAVLVGIGLGATIGGVIAFVVTSRQYQPAPIIATPSAPVSLIGYY